MQPIREIARKIVAEMEGIRLECYPPLAEEYRRQCVIDYAYFLKNSPSRSPELNDISLQKVRAQAKKAVSLGVPVESMDASLASVRNHWLPKLKEVTHAD